MPAIATGYCGTFGQHHRDPVALGEALRLQPGSERDRGLVDLAEGDRLAHELVGHGIRVAAEALVEQRHERRVLRHVDLGRHACGVLLQPGFFHRSTLALPSGERRF
jgi:hypothetical protein